MKDDLNTDHGAERNGARGVVVDGDAVDEEGDDSDDNREKEGRGERLLDPLATW